jgi:hypothetical protein
VVASGQHHRGLHQHIDRQGGERVPDQPQATGWRSSPVPDSSQMTTVDAPISISESRPNPASATDWAEIAAIASTTTPATFQASVTYSRPKPPAQQGAPRRGISRSHHPSLAGYPWQWRERP